MALLLNDQPSCSTAWLAAVEAVDAESGHEAHNVMIEVTEPLRWSDEDQRIAEAVDQFLNQHGGWPLSTITNTIFPEALYHRHGVDGLYSAYRRILPKMSRGSNNWGRYFGRMIEHRTADGQKINPLEDQVIKRLRRYVHGEGRIQRNIYELRVYDPDADISIHDPGTETERPVGGRPCLSFLSFKLDGANRLLLTALYRNHYYIQRLLGNLVGLGPKRLEIDRGSAPFRRRFIREAIERCDRLSKFRLAAIAWMSDPVTRNSELLQSKLCVPPNCDDLDRPYQFQEP